MIGYLTWMTRLKRKKELPSTNKNDVRFGTPSEIAEYRAQRLAAVHPDTIIDVGAGAGFQTIAFSKVAAKVIAIDIDKERLERGEFPANVTIIAGDALDKSVIEQVKALATGKIAVFLDPERPPESAHRSIDEIKPNIFNFVKEYGAITKDIAIELPPFLESIPLECEREYASIDYRLNRLTIYMGALMQSGVSVVQLPSGARIESEGGDEKHDDATNDDGTQIIITQSRAPHGKYLLEPDAALVQAGIVKEALPPEASTLLLGKKRTYIADTLPSNTFFKTYRVLFIGKKGIAGALREHEAVIVHGSMSEQEQKKILKELTPFCKGRGRAHLFIGADWYVCRPQKLH